jgi:DNA-binding NtrC family response regulator
MIRILCEGVVRSFRSLPVTIGRDEDNDLPVNDTKLSRRHCRVVRSPDGIVLEDLESSNGTFVNGVRIRRQVLSAGDSILIGITSLTIEWDPAAAPPPKARRPTAHDVEVLRTENLRLKWLVQLARSLATAGGETAVLRRIIDSAIELTGAERGFLFVVTLRGLEFHAARDAAGVDLESPQDRISHSIASEAIETGKPVVTEDAGGDARFAGGSSVAFLHLRSVLCVPLKVKDGPIGALYLEHATVTGKFRPRDIPHVTAFADFAALTLSNARSVAALERRGEQLRSSRERVRQLNTRLREVLRRESRERAGGRSGSDPLGPDLGLRREFGAIVGQSPGMRRVLGELDRVIDSSIPVLIQGESGTGKELVARALHDHGPSARGPFVSINCAAIPADLIEVELFGREAGAYTGADGPAPGLVERANGGSLFLDEVADMPQETQGKLLRALEEGEVRRVGGTQPRKVTFRLVAATNRNLRELVSAGGFREDLYYRLAGITLTLPPLRERVEDIPILLDHFVDACCAEQGVDRPEVDPEVMDRMQAYPWPGNVRELRNEVQRLFVLQRGRIGPDLLSPPVYSGDPEAAPPEELPAGGLRELVDRLERRIILDTMRRVEGNKTRAAQLLGLSRLGLRKKLERLGLTALD